MRSILRSISNLRTVSNIHILRDDGCTNYDLVIPILPEISARYEVATFWQLRFSGVSMNALVTICCLQLITTCQPDVKLPLFGYFVSHE